jgi:hypothetical protein
MDSPCRRVERTKLELQASMEDENLIPRRRAMETGSEWLRMKVGRWASRAQRRFDFSGEMMTNFAKED